MTKTKIRNETTVVITLKEGNAGMLRKLCDLQPRGYYTVTSELNQTYKEYWCIGKGSDQFTLSSDDLVEWKEIVIKPLDNDETKFTWEGRPPKKQENPTENPGTSPHPSLLTRMFGWVKSKPSGSTPVKTNVTTDLTTAKTTIVTSGPDSAKNTSTSVAPPDAAIPTTTVTRTTVTSTVTSTPAAIPTPIP